MVKREDEQPPSFPPPPVGGVIDAAAVFADVDVSDNALKRALDSGLDIDQNEDPTMTQTQTVVVQGMEDSSSSNNINNISSKKQRSGCTTDSVLPPPPATSDTTGALSAHAEEVTIPPGTEGISTFNDYDVLSGRGGGTNVHSGNRDFRDMINQYRTTYLQAKKNNKPAISRSIVREIRSRGGRFLKRGKDSLWYEIGDDLAREKTSQALRQRAPEIRKLMFDAAQSSAMVVNANAAGVSVGRLGGVNGTGGEDGAQGGAAAVAAVASGPGATTTTAEPSMGDAINDPYRRQHLLAMGALNQQHLLNTQNPPMVITPMMAAAVNRGGAPNPALLQAMMAANMGGMHVMGMSGMPGMGFPLQGGMPQQQFVQRLGGIGPGAAPSTGFTPIHPNTNTALGATATAAPAVPGPVGGPGPGHSSATGGVEGAAEV